MKESNRKLKLIEDIDSPLPGPADGEDTGLANLIIDAINDEWEAIQGYNVLKANLGEYGEYSEFLPIIDDIAAEENNHVGMLQKMLSKISPNTEYISQGEEEAYSDLDEALDFPPNKKHYVITGVTKSGREDLEKYVNSLDKAYTIVADMLSIDMKNNSEGELPKFYAYYIHEPFEVDYEENKFGDKYVALEEGCILEITFDEYTRTWNIKPENSPFNSYLIDDKIFKRGGKDLLHLDEAIFNLDRVDNLVPVEDVVMADAQQFSAKRETEIEQNLKDANKLPELRKPFLGAEKQPTPKEPQLPKLELEESVFEDFTEDEVDAKIKKYNKEHKSKLIMSEAKKEADEKDAKLILKKEEEDNRGPFLKTIKGTKKDRNETNALSGDYTGPIEYLDHTIKSTNKGKTYQVFKGEEILRGDIESLGDAKKYILKLYYDDID